MKTNYNLRVMWDTNSIQRLTLQLTASCGIYGRPLQPEQVCSGKRLSQPPFQYEALKMFLRQVIQEPYRHALLTKLHIYGPYRTFQIKYRKNIRLKAQELINDF